MAFDLEAIEVALFNLLIAGTESGGYQRRSRALKLWPNTGIENEKAWYLISGGVNTSQQEAIGLPKYTIRWVLKVYIWAKDDREYVTQTDLNNAFTAFVNAMKGKPPGSKQTLGGLVNNCAIDGDWITDPAVLQQQGWGELMIVATTGI